MAAFWCCGAGLRLAAGGTQLSRTWIVYNKPGEPTWGHAGVLMGLGLTGRPPCSAASSAHACVRGKHHATSSLRGGPSAACNRRNKIALPEPGTLLIFAGHLKGLSDTDVYRYLRQEHDATTGGSPTRHRPQQSLHRAGLHGALL